MVQTDEAGVFGDVLAIPQAQQCKSAHASRFNPFVATQATDVSAFGVATAIHQAKWQNHFAAGMLYCLASGCRCRKTWRCTGHSPGICIGATLRLWLEGCVRVCCRPLCAAGYCCWSSWRCRGDLSGANPFFGHVVLMLAAVLCALGR